MWSGPRNISTAMLRSWGNRPDAIVTDEPLYAHYLKVTGLEHPGAPETLATHESDWEKVVQQLTDVDADVLVDLIEEREAVQSTGIGEGLALPHAMVPGVAEPTLFLFRLRPEVNYQSLDGEPVAIVFLLLSPSTGLREHLQLLGRVAQVVGRANLLDRLRAAVAGDEAHRILLSEDAESAL